MSYRRSIQHFLTLGPFKSAFEWGARCLNLLRQNFIFRKIWDWLYRSYYPALKKEVFGIEFPNPLGLAAGLDRNAEFYNDFGSLGFGFVEIGTLTPKAQKAPDQVELVKIHAEKSIVSNTGIANKGIQEVIKNLKKQRPEVIVAANVSYNSFTREEDIVNDYERAVSLLYDFVDFFIINISYADRFLRSPMEDPSFLSEVMDEVLDKRTNMDSLKPILLKISPDIPREQLDAILRYSMASGIDGIVVGDAMRNRDGLLKSKNTDSDAYVSGAALFAKNLELVRHVHDFTKGRLAIIGTGGIMSPEDAQMMLDAGASLIEILSGFLYQGPSLVKQILKQLDLNLKHNG